MPMEQMIPESMRDKMRERTNWGDLLEEPRAGRARTVRQHRGIAMSDDEARRKWPTTRLSATRRRPTPRRRAGRRRRTPAASVKKGGLGVAIAIVLSLTWYLLADRYTPYTSQARIEGFVVGVAPKVAGKVTRVTGHQQPGGEERPAAVRDRPLAVSASRWTRRGPTSRTPASRSAPAARPSKRPAPTLLAARANELKARQDADAARAACTKRTRARSRYAAWKLPRPARDQAKAQVTAAEADIQRAIEQMGGDDIENNTILKTALTAVDKAELDLANTLVRATVARRHHGPHDRRRPVCRHRQPGADADRDPTRSGSTPSSPRTTWVT